MYWWYVLPPSDGGSVCVIGTSLMLEPPLCIGPAAMVAPNTPVPQQALTTQVVNGVMQVVVNTQILNTLLPGLKLL